MNSLELIFDLIATNAALADVVWLRVGYCALD